MSPISKEWKELNDNLSTKSVSYLDYLETHGESAAKEKYSTEITEINKTQVALKKI